jgi:hypothetical protein
MSAALAPFTIGIHAILVMTVDVLCCMRECSWHHLLLRHAQQKYASNTACLQVFALWICICLIAALMM